MEFFVYCRDKPSRARLREELAEAHWSYMDGFADAMIARGPTLTPDREIATGSLHIVDLPDPEAGAGLRVRGTLLPGRRLRGTARAPMGQRARRDDVGLR